MISWIESILLQNWTDLEDEQGFRFTVYNITIKLEDGRSWKVAKRYSEVETLHTKMVMTHPKIQEFRFPRKSVFNTFAEYTRERRRWVG